MTREEFESILEEAFLEWFNDAYEEIINESNKETKARNTNSIKVTKISLLLSYICLF